MTNLTIFCILHFAMILAVFGGTGKAGQVFVKTALEKGYTVRLLARNPQKLTYTHPNLKILSGDATHYEAVNTTITSSEAVVSLLGHTPNSPSNIQELFGMHVLKSMSEQKVKRLLILTGNGIFLPGDNPNWLDRTITFMLKLVDPDRLQDASKHIQQILNSDTDWTIVRTPIQTSWSCNQKLVVGPVGTPNMGLTVSRQKIADFMLQALEQGQYIRQYPAIAEALI